MQASCREHRQRQRHHIEENPWTRVQAWINIPAQGLNISPNIPVMMLLPLAGAAKLFHWNATVILVVNIVAIIFSVSSDKLAEHLGELQGALLSATFGNTVELTVSWSFHLILALDIAMLIENRPGLWLWCMARSHLRSLLWLEVFSQIFS
jgi:hypothetical protein